MSPSPQPFPAFRFAAHLRRVLLIAAAAALPTSAAALSETYAGALLPDSAEGPIPVVVELRDVGTILTGKVDAAFPLSGSGIISSGENRAGVCNLKVVLNYAFTLRLQGSCRPQVFEGRYVIQNTQRNTTSKGSFRLTRRPPEEAKKPASAASAPVAKTSVVACQKTNVHCLTACPRGDADAEFLCANRCRAKLEACKTKSGKLH